jgi:TolB-like protein
MMRRLLVLALLAVAATLALPRAFAMEQLDIDKELRLLKRGQSQLHIPGARFRVAVFTFEDPDRTGLGDALARILSHDILVRSAVSSIGVLRYVGGLSAPAAEDLSYYDKVEALTEAQQVTIAVWGMVRRQGERLIIDSYAQIPPTTLRRAFSWSFNLPRAMGGGTLAAQLNPDRILVQRYELAAAEAQALHASAARVNQLRAKALDGDPVIAELPMDSVYFLQERRGDWVLVNAGPGRTGWVRAAGHCGSACSPLLDAARFISGLLGFIQSNNPPEVAATLTPDAHAARDELVSLVALDEARPEISEQEALRFVSPWLAASAGVPPGGAAFGNLRALIRIVGALKREGSERGQPFDQRKLPRGEVTEIADDLARASQIDPRNAVVLRNLTVLFDYIHDEGRAQLARELAQDAERTSRGAAGIVP